MTLKEEIVAVNARLAHAQTERDGWRSTGRREKYLEAFSTTEALELRLEQLRREGLARNLK